MKKLILAILFLSPVLLQSQLDVFELEGRWQIGDKPNFEVWSVNFDTLNGYGCQLINGEEVITEYLKIFKTEGLWIYAAQVLDQNEGRVVEFTQNSIDDSCIEFVNVEHDFPQRIRYCLEDPDHMKVSVWNLSREGFELDFNRSR